MVETPPAEIAKQQLRLKYANATLNLANNVAAVSQAISGKQSKALFALQKAAAIAQVFVSTKTAAANALLTTKMYLQI